MAYITIDKHSKSFPLKSAARTRGYFRLEKLFGLLEANCCRTQRKCGMEHRGKYIEGIIASRHKINKTSFAACVKVRS